MPRLGLIAILLGLCVGAVDAADKTPNVVFIVADDMGWTDYGFMGHEHIRTPHLDRLSKEGLVFQRGYVASSLCRPSLVTILSGLYPHQHKITSNDPPIPTGAPKRDAERSEKFLADRQRMIDNIDRVPTLPRVLQQRGYVSFQTGKWWEGNFRRGGFTDGMSLGGRHGDKGLEIGRTTMQPMFDFVSRAAADGKPFFLWYAPMLPHTPHNPPERLLSKYAKLAPTPSIASYWAMCEWFDETCGQLLQFIDDKGLRDNTLVVYITDNGWIQSSQGKNYAAKSKQSPYDGGLRTPIIVRWPGHVSPTTIATPVSTVDLAPTMLTACQVAPPSNMPGTNLLEVAAGKPYPRDLVCGEIFTHDAVDIDRPAANLTHRWCVEDRWKLIVPHDSPVRAELYDLANDPTETKNIAAEQPDTVARLRSRLDAWWPAD